MTGRHFDEFRKPPFVAATGQNPAAQQPLLCLVELQRHPSRWLRREYLFRLQRRCVGKRARRRRVV